MDTLAELKELLASHATHAPQLDDAEMETLRRLSAPGQPLFKIFKSVLDYDVSMRETIASAPLDTDEGVRLARQLQLKRQATLDFVKWFIQLYDIPSRKPQQKDTSRG